jgi:hypothetical protein
MNWIVYLLAAALLPSAVAMTPPEAKAIYSVDTQKIRSGDLTFDWQQYRLAAVISGASGAYDWHSARTRFMQQLEHGDVDAALRSADEIKKHNMAEPEGHLLAMLALQKMGKEQEAVFEHDVVAAFLHSIQRSGDGKSRGTAYVVVTTDEEYTFLRLTMQVTLPLSQSLIVTDGHSYDLLKVKAEDGSEQQVWFNVDASMDALHNALGMPPAR